MAKEKCKKQIYLSDLAVANAYLHNLHWNVKGPQFKSVHEYLESLYDQIFEMYDEVAERMKMDGVYPLANLKEYLEATDLKELETEVDYTEKDALTKALELYKHLRKHAVEIREAADEKGEFWWVAMMEDQCAIFDKEIWFMEQAKK